MFDSLVKWDGHINSAKQACQKPFNLIKSISSLKYGADQRAPMMLYRALIRAKLDYGSIVYNSTAKNNLKHT